MEINGMHKDMTKLNSLIAKNATLSEKLSNSNFGMEQEFVEELKELQHDSDTAECKFARIQVEKTSLLEEILEVETQAMMWEKKIQLEKETQAALDPEVGQQEARDMEREIHRMEIRFENLKREQERMVSEMERSLHKHESIAIRGRGQKDNESTAASMTKKVSLLQNDVRKSKASIVKYDAAIKNKMERHEVQGLEVERIGAECNQKNDRMLNTQKQIGKTLFKNERYKDSITRMKAMNKRLHQVVKGKIAPIDESQRVRLEDEYDHSMTSVALVIEMTKGLGHQHGHIKEVLDRVALLAENVV